MPSPTPAGSLLSRRLVIVTGKGGTGKTTVSVALALAVSRRGRRVLLAEIGLGQEIGTWIGPGAPSLGYEPVELAPCLEAIRIDPYEALAEYLGLQIGWRGMVRRVLRNRAFRQLMDASPGWRELITLGKVWHLEQMKTPAGEPRFDLLVVDAPATGHGLTFLDVPRVVVSAVRSGPLRRHAIWVEELVRDPERTLLLPVALAEELPARETAELVARLRGQLGVAVDRVVVNAVAPPPFPAELADLDARLAAIPEPLQVPGAPSPRTLAACAAHLRARHALNERWLSEIGRLTTLPVVPLPYRRDASTPEGLLALGEGLLHAVDSS